MKIRQGFVSNSSSSSFAVIEGVAAPLTIEGTYVIGQDGEREFGWGVYDCFDFHSKANWAWLQAYYAERPDLQNMLVSIIQECTGATNVENLLNPSSEGDSGVWCYIDHQSTGALEIFDTPEELKRFLFGGSSYVHLDNDNHE